MVAAAQVEPEWLVARFVPDLRRGEPRNIGIVLFHRGSVYSRFVGEKADDDVDGRRLRSIGAFHENYKSWVHYWRKTATLENVNKLLSRRPGDNYFLERGGRLIAGEARDPNAFLQKIYSEVVADSPGEDQPELEEEPDEVQQVFSEVGSRFNVETDVVVDIDPDMLIFQYGIQADKQLLFRKCKLNSNAKKTWALIHDTVHSVNAAVTGARDPYALAFEHDPGADVSRQMATLSKRLPGRLLTLGGVPAMVEKICRLADGKPRIPT